MKLSSKNRIITSALAGILALGVAGCSFSAETKTTLSTEAGGEETTTTTETKADDSGVSTSTSTTSTSSHNIYDNKNFGYIYSYPEGFEEKKDVEATTNDEKLDLMLQNSNGSSVAITVISDIANKQGVTGLEMWAKGFADSLKQSLESQGETITKIEPELVTIHNTLDCATVYSESTKDGTTMYRKAYLFLDKDGNGSIIRMQANNEEDFKAMDTDHVGVLTNE